MSSNSAWIACTNSGSRSPGGSSSSTAARAAESSAADVADVRGRGSSARPARVRTPTPRHTGGARALRGGGERRGAGLTVETTRAERAAIFPAKSRSTGDAWKFHHHRNVRRRRARRRQSRRRSEVLGRTRSRRRRRRFGSVRRRRDRRRGTIVGVGRVSRRGFVDGEKLRRVRVLRIAEPALDVLQRSAHDLGM